MRSINLFLIGDFPYGYQNTARIKSICSEFSKLGYDTQVNLLYPTRFQLESNAEPQSIWESTLIAHLSWTTKFQPNKVLRLLQIMHGILVSVFVALRQPKASVSYFYNPTLLSTSWALWVLKLRGLKTIVDQTELYSLERWPHIHRLGEQWAAKHATVFSVISKPLYDHFKPLRPNTIITPIMVDVERFEVDISAREKTIGYIGSFHTKDGIPFVLRAFAKALQKDSALRLVLIGNSLQYPNLAVEIEELGIQDAVTTTGTVEYDEIPRLLKQCDTLLMNRDASTFSSYGYPIKLGEYLACNRVVLMSDNKGYAEDFTDKQEVIKFIPQDEESLVNAIAFRYANLTLAEQIAVNGYHYAKEHFDKQKLVLNLLQLLD